MATERALCPPSWVDWCTHCSAYRPHGLVTVAGVISGGYCSVCGTQHLSMAIG